MDSFDNVNMQLLEKNLTQMFNQRRNKYQEIVWKDKTRSELSEEWRSYCKALISMHGVALNWSEVRQKEVFELIYKEVDSHLSSGSLRFHINWEQEDYEKVYLLASEVIAKAALER